MSATSESVELFHHLMPGPYDWTFGDHLRKIRRVHDLTQEEFARALNVNPKSLAAWEADSWLPRDIVTLAKRIQLSYGVPVNWTLGILDHVETSPAGEADEGRDVRRQGLEPRTRYVRASASQSGIAEIIPIDSDPEPSDFVGREAEADVITLPTWLNRPGISRRALR